MMRNYYILFNRLTGSPSRARLNLRILPLSKRALQLNNLKDGLYILVSHIILVIRYMTHLKTTKSLKFNRVVVGLPVIARKIVEER